MSVHPKNTLNDLSAQEWISRTVSVFVQRGLGKDSEQAHYEKLHPAPFSFQDVARFIEFFSKSGELILDPFVGIGSTLKAASLLGRRSIGIELNPYFAAMAKERLQVELPNDLLTKKNYKVLQGDVRDTANKLEDHSIDFIVTSPPYWGILDKIDHKARSERLLNGYHHNYGNLDNDLSKIDSYDDFVEEITNVFSALNKKLKPKRYAVIIVGDFRHKSRYFMYHSDLAGSMQRTNSWSLKGIAILYQKHKKVYPYGYPYAYVPNMHHQYALVMQKEADNAY